MKKICKKCFKEKDLSQFHKCNSNTDGHHNTCIDCRKEKSRLYRENNRDVLRKKAKGQYQRFKETIQNWRDNNREHIKQKTRERYNKNKDERNEKRREYYRKNKDVILPKLYEYKKNNADKVKEWNKKDYENNKERCILHSKVRKHKVRAVSDGTINRKSLKDLLNKQNNKCKICGCSLDILKKYTVHLDHIIPISKGGLNSIENVQYLCAKCNLSKSNILGKG